MALLDTTDEAIRGTADGCNVFIEEEVSRVVKEMNEKYPKLMSIAKATVVGAMLYQQMAMDKLTKEHLIDYAVFPAAVTLKLMEEANEGIKLG